jgi:peptidoglycan/xylan/chitin deacetylase (PgdA/CDA1 family)
MKAPGYLALLLVFVLLAGCSPMNPKTSTKDASPSPTHKMLQNNGQNQGKVLTQKSADKPTPDLAGGKEISVREPQPLTLAELRKKYKSTFVLNAPSSKKEVALTFDDAPDGEFTPKILDVLKREGVKATFFVVGNRIEAHPDIMRRIVAEGHAIGNHSYNHANLPKLTDAEFRQQIRKTDELIRHYTGYVPTIVRPPYGAISEEQIKWLKSQNKIVINWNVDSLDWKSLDAKTVEANVLAHVFPGSIILQHSGGGTGEDLTGTVEALPNIIKHLRENGLKMVTIPQLLDRPFP